jgi:hypothetical protein
MHQSCDDCIAFVANALESFQTTTKYYDKNFYNQAKMIVEDCLDRHERGDTTANYGVQSRINPHNNNYNSLIVQLRERLGELIALADRYQRMKLLATVSMEEQEEGDEDDDDDYYYDNEKDCNNDHSHSSSHPAKSMSVMIHPSREALEQQRQDEVDEVSISDVDSTGKNSGTILDDDETETEDNPDYLYDGGDDAYDDGTIVF